MDAPRGIFKRWRGAIASLFRDDIASAADGDPIGNGAFARFGHTDLREWAQAEIVSATTDSDALNPGLGSGARHRKVQSVAISVPTWAGQRVRVQVGQAAHAAISA